MTEKYDSHLSRISGRPGERWQVALVKRLLNLHEPIHLKLINNSEKVATARGERE